jgi:hypothetical protein
MILHALREAPNARLAESLAAFETQFTYPLGPGRFFRISHGDDYPRFFRAIGDATCFIAEHDGVVLGTLGVALCRLATPDGGERRAVYVGDLKLAPSARGGVVLRLLARSAETQLRPRTDTAFSVVMDGTRVTPETYTGRAGLPSFRAVGKVMVFRIPTSSADASDRAISLTTPADGVEYYRRLSAGRYHCCGGDPTERSQTPPQWLCNASACGLLEDTRRGKRLIADDGQEMRSAHLSHFAFRRVEDTFALLAVARRLAEQRGFPALFVTVAERDTAALREAVAGWNPVLAPATVYAAGLDAGGDWNINSSEI